MIHTIGYGGLKDATELAILVDRLDAVLIDIRGKPVSRKAGFSRKPLERLLGDGYEWRGDRLGNADGHSVTPAGIEELGLDFASEDEEGMESNCVIMCQEENPLDCHRWKVAAGIETRVRAEVGDWLDSVLVCHHWLIDPKATGDDRYSVIVWQLDGFKEKANPADLAIMSMADYEKARAAPGGVYVGIAEHMASFVEAEMKRSEAEAKG